MRKFNISNLRLEPLVDSVNQDIWGYEVLSDLYDNICTEEWFSNMDTIKQISLLHKQMNAVYDLNLLRKCFFNLSAHGIISLSQEDISRVSKFKKFSIEISDINIIFALSQNEMVLLLKNINKLRLADINVWIDDLTSFNSMLLPLFVGRVDGVKIDRSELKGGNLGKLTAQINDILGSVPVLMEGVETHSDLNIVNKFSISHAQGYLWKSCNLVTAIPNRVSITI
ncbi:EAL domain-containing protein [Enterobacter asburiae]|uniref:EAL domain-containing protein n=1 Tax=Enterobacter asburiae TaxID=61645 RepID=UPI0032B013B1